MTLTGALESLVIISFSAALPLFTLGVHRFKDTPFGGVLLLQPLFLVLAVVAVVLDQVVTDPSLVRTTTLALVVIGALCAAVGAIRFFRLASGRWSV